MLGWPWHQVRPSIEVDSELWKKSTEAAAARSDSRRRAGAATQEHTYKQTQPFLSIDLRNHQFAIVLLFDRWSPPAMESVWKQCDALAHPQLNPLRAVLYMVYITYLPHVLRIPMVFKAQGYYNNTHARKQTDGRLDDKPFGRAVFRATSAHLNSFEALILFSAACFTAHLAELDAATASGLCGFFLACRFLYVLLYIGGTTGAIGLARSLVWVGGFAATLRLFGLSLAKLGL